MTNSNLASPRSSAFEVDPARRGPDKLSDRGFERLVSSDAGADSLNNCNEAATFRPIPDEAAGTAVILGDEDEELDSVLRKRGRAVLGGDCNKDGCDEEAGGGIVSDLVALDGLYVSCSGVRSVASPSESEPLSYRGLPEILDRTLWLNVWDEAGVIDSCLGEEWAVLATELGGDSGHGKECCCLAGTSSEPIDSSEGKKYETAADRSKE